LKDQCPAQEPIATPILGTGGYLKERGGNFMPKRFAFATMLSLVVAAAVATNGSAVPPPPFSNTLLTVPFTSTDPNVVASTTGDSEPSISIGANGHMAVGGLAWIPFAVNMWTGTAGSTPTFFGAMDTTIPERGARTGLGDGDEDIDIASTGTTHLADLDFVVNPTFRSFTLGVSVTNCPSNATGPSGCSTKVLDTAGADREWITSRGANVWVSYHDSGNSSLIHVQRSTDDGATWRNVGSPIPGQGSATGDATFNNIQGPIVADPTSTALLDIYAAGEPSIQKGTSAAFNNIFISRSTDGGRTWTAHRIFHAPLFTALDNIFPSLAVDPVSGQAYATWSDGHAIWVSTSIDHGVNWSTVPVKVNSVATGIFPWVAAYHGKVDVVYYGTAAATNGPGAVWNTYDAQSHDAGATFSEVKVSQTSNHSGLICTQGTGCANPLVNRTLLDLFEVAENPASDTGPGTAKASLVYADDTINTWTLNGGVLPLPEIVLAQEN
jgi:hypothetical protein